MSYSHSTVVQMWCILSHTSWLQDHSTCFAILFRNNLLAPSLHILRVTHVYEMIIGDQVTSSFSCFLLTLMQCFFVNGLCKKKTINLEIWSMLHNCNLSFPKVVMITTIAQLSCMTENSIGHFLAQLAFGCLTYFLNCKCCDFSYSDLFGTLREKLVNFSRRVIANS